MGHFEFSGSQALYGPVRSAEAASARLFLANNGDLCVAPPAFVDAVLDKCGWRRFDAGDTITHAEDTDGAMYAVVDGAVAFSSSLGPADAQLAHILHPGEWFGFGPLLTGKPRVGSIVARSVGLLAVIEQRAMTELLQHNPEWWRHIGQMAQHYGNRAANIATDLMIPDSQRRCIATLLRLAGCRFADMPLNRPRQAYVSQEEIGAISNLSRNSVSRILLTLQSRQLIEIGYHSITLTNADVLRAIADDA